MRSETRSRVRGDRNFPCSFWRQAEPCQGVCAHEGCGAEIHWTEGHKRSGKPRLWCAEHAPPKWAMRRKRAQERDRGVRQLKTPEEYAATLARLPACCREAGKV